MTSRLPTITTINGTSEVRTMPEERNYLAHHGVKGQRWGVRKALMAIDAYDRLDDTSPGGYVTYAVAPESNHKNR